MNLEVSLGSPMKKDGRKKGSDQADRQCIIHVREMGCKPIFT